MLRTVWSSHPCWTFCSLSGLGYVLSLWLDISQFLRIGLCPQLKAGYFAITQNWLVFSIMLVFCSFLGLGGILSLWLVVSQFLRTGWFSVSGRINLRCISILLEGLRHFAGLVSASRWIRFQLFAGMSSASRRHGLSLRTGLVFSILLAWSSASRWLGLSLSGPEYLQRLVGLFPVR